MEPILSTIYTIHEQKNIIPWQGRLFTQEQLIVEAANGGDARSSLLHSSYLELYRQRGR
jgi:hypothetical protein